MSFTLDLGRLQTAGLAKEAGATPGTLVTPPTDYLLVVPPDSFYPSFTPINAKAIIGQAEFPNLMQAGFGENKGMKLKVPASPATIGNLLMAAYGVDTVSGPTDTAAYTHPFTRIQSASLPTYSFWFKKASKYLQFTGCMLDKLTLAWKPRENLLFDMDWIGLGYDDTGATHTATYDTIAPFKFSQTVLKVGGSTAANYTDVEISIQNHCSHDFTVTNSQFPSIVYSEGQEVDIKATFLFGNADEYAKFLACTDTSFNVKFTHGTKIPSCASTYYSMEIDIPTVKYMAAPLPLPEGKIACAYTAKAYLTPGGSYMSKIILVNGHTAAY